MSVVEPCWRTARSALPASVATVAVISATSVPARAPANSTVRRLPLNETTCTSAPKAAVSAACTSSLLASSAIAAVALPPKVSVKVAAGALVVMASVCCSATAAWPLRTS